MMRLPTDMLLRLAEKECRHAAERMLLLADDIADYLDDERPDDE